MHITLPLDILFLALWFIMLFVVFGVLGYIADRYFGE